MHDKLIFHLAGGELAGGSIAAVESHKGVFLCIIELALDIFPVYVVGNRVVDVQKSYRIAAYAHSDILAYRAVYVNFTGYGYSHGGKA